MTTEAVYGRSWPAANAIAREADECWYMACAVLGFTRHSSGQLPHDLGLEPACLAVRPLQSIEKLVGR